MSDSLWIAGSAAAVLVGGTAAALFLADRIGRRFFDEGRAAVELLGGLAASLRARRQEAIAGHFADAFSGHDLGLTTPMPVSERDGIRTLRFVTSGATQNRQQAASAWEAYLSGFATIEEAGLHLSHVERRAPDLQATIRFELVGTPHGASRPAIDRATLRMWFARTAEGLRIRDAELVSGERIAADRAQFADVAAVAGIDFANRYYPPFLDDQLVFAMLRHGPAGITVVDYDNDGFYDLFIPDGVASRLYRNRRDGTFEDVTEKAGLSGLDGVSTAIFGDYNNDGFKDLFVSRSFRPNQLFRNNGDGTFTDVTAQSGLGADSCTTAAAWADYDNDGKLDLYVGRYLDPRKAAPTTLYARNGEPNRLYHNNGDGTFTDVTERAGVADPGLCLAVAWGDYNDDGFPDLFVSNDFGRSTLYRNNGDGTFKDVSVEAGALCYGAGMNATWADYDNDGKLDLYETDIRSEHAWFAEPPAIACHMANTVRQNVWLSDMPLYFQIFRQSGFNFIEVFREMAAGNHLLKNRGDGTFENVTARAGANPIGWFWGAVFADFDNDGWLDLYAANGWIYGERGTELELDFWKDVVTRQSEFKKGTFFHPSYFGTRSWHGWERNRHLRSNQDGTFQEIGCAAGTDLVLNSRGVAAADFWNRGVVDLVVAGSNARHALLRNELVDRRHWLQVELVGTRSNRDAVGARVTVVCGKLSQMREVSAGDGYGSQSALRQHFGLGSVTVVDELVVRWPASKTEQRFTRVAADRIVEVTEGSDRLVEKQYQATPIEVTHG